MTDRPCLHSDRELIRLPRHGRTGADHILGAPLRRRSSDNRRSHLAGLRFPARWWRSPVALNFVGDATAGPLSTRRNGDRRMAAVIEASDLSTNFGRGRRGEGGERPSESPSIAVRRGVVVTSAPASARSSCRSLDSWPQRPPPHGSVKFHGPGDSSISRSRSQQGPRREDVDDS